MRFVVHIQFAGNTETIEVPGGYYQGGEWVDILDAGDVLGWVYAEVPLGDDKISPILRIVIEPRHDQISREEMERLKHI